VIPLSTIADIGTQFWGGGGGVDWSTALIALNNMHVFVLVFKP
jgi:hypothetical protein